ncbi:MAG TPA: hypothetical protein VKX39_06375 [Bryobacteraceae bacterium]|jgi:hypothetical protein|nr:hypothetical protein [Bryobacteraceae bacterium]
MEPTRDDFEHRPPSTNDLIRDVIETGRNMFAAGKRLLDDLERLRTNAGESEWRFEFRKHPYLWIGASVGACLLLAAMLRSKEEREEPQESDVYPYRYS